MKLATDGINRCFDYLATTAKQSQYIDELVVALAQARANHFGMLAVLTERFDGLGQRNRPVGVDSGPLFRLSKTGVSVRGVGGDGRQADSAKQQTYRKKSGNRHGRGVNGAPVNAA
jgi:hypothetical protein